MPSRVRRSLGLVVEEGPGGVSSVKYVRDGTALASAGLRINDSFFAVSQCLRSSH